MWKVRQVVRGLKDEKVLKKVGKTCNCQTQCLLTLRKRALYTSASILSFSGRIVNKWTNNNKYNKWIIIFLKAWSRTNLLGSSEVYFHFTDSKTASCWHSCPVTSSRLSGLKRIQLFSRYFNWLLELVAFVGNFERRDLVFKKSFTPLLDKDPFFAKIKLARSWNLSDHCAIKIENGLGKIGSYIRYKRKRWGTTEL